MKPERGCRAQGVPGREWEEEQQRELGCRKEKKALEGGGLDWDAGLSGSGLQVSQGRSAGKERKPSTEN